MASFLMSDIISLYQLYPRMELVGGMCPNLGICKRLLIYVAKLPSRSDISTYSQKVYFE